MQLVVPSAVNAAVMMLAMTCKIVFQVSFFIILQFFNSSILQFFNPSILQFFNPSL